jgi:hypothetical protein
MKSVSEELAEYVGRTGAEELAPLILEVEGMERALVMFTKYVYTATQEGRRLIQEADRVMSDGQTPERRAEVDKAAQEALANAKKQHEAAHQAKMESITKRLEEAEAAGDEAEIAKVVNETLEQLFGKA